MGTLAPIQAPKETIVADRQGIVIRGNVELLGEGGGNLSYTNLKPGVFVKRGSNTDEAILAGAGDVAWGLLAWEDNPSWSMPLDRDTIFKLDDNGAFPRVSLIKGRPWAMARAAGALAVDVQVKLAALGEVTTWVDGTDNWNLRVGRVAIAVGGAGIVLIQLEVNS